MRQERRGFEAPTGALVPIFPTVADLERPPRRFCPHRYSSCPPTAAAPLPPSLPPSVTAAGAPAVATGTMAMAACAPAAVAGEAALEVAASGAPAATAVAASAAEAGARSPPLAAGTAPLDDLAAWCQRLGDPAEAAEHDYAMDYSLLLKSLLIITQMSFSLLIITPPLLKGHIADAEQH